MSDDRTRMQTHQHSAYELGSVPRGGRPVSSLPLTRETYTAELYELMGQFAGVMATVETADDLRGQYAVLRDIQVRMRQLYARKRASCPVER